MTGRRSCVNSLWSGSERVRIGERLKATLAGIMELDLLRGRQLELVDAVLEESGKTAESVAAQQGANLESAAADGAAKARRQQTPPPADSMLPGLGTGEGISSRWSTLSWDIPSELLSPPTPEPTGTTSLDCDSRPSSGFYSVSGSSLSDSCYSVASEAAPGGPVKMGGTCRPHSLDHSTTQWREVEQQSVPSSEGTVPGQKGERRPASTGELEIDGFMFLTGLCSSLRGAQKGSVFSTSTTNSQLQLDPKFCSDLVSRRTKEVYPYPSPLHAVALQSPLFTSCQDSSPTCRSPSPEGDQPGELEPEEPPVRTQPPPSPSITQLEQYITRLVHQYHSRVAAEASQKTAGLSHEGVHPRSASSSSLTGGSATPCKSLLGNSARVSLSSIGKKASRNSINLGNLPSVTGEDFNISFHLNLNLNLNPNLNKALSFDAKNMKEQVSGSCGHLSANLITPTASPSSSSSTVTSTPNWRSRPRISTCPSTVNHRGSLEITGKSFGPLNFSKSLDWSGAPREEAEGCPPSKASESPAKLSEDSAVVCEISRVSGLPKSVVVGLMEEGVELDAECFRSERERAQQPQTPGQEVAAWNQTTFRSSTGYRLLIQIPIRCLRRSPTALALITLDQLLLALPPSCRYLTVSQTRPLLLALLPTQEYTPLLVCSRIRRLLLPNCLCSGETPHPSALSRTFTPVAPRWKAPLGLVAVPSGRMLALQVGGGLRREAGGGVGMGRGSIRASMPLESWCGRQQSVVTQEETLAAAGRKKQVLGLQKRLQSFGKALSPGFGGKRRTWEGTEMKGLGLLVGGTHL
ncbi:hypothetical protein AOLI_G00059240 [Acnodon oligacanthus]